MFLSFPYAYALLYLGVWVLVLPTSFSFSFSINLEDMLLTISLFFLVSHFPPHRHRNSPDPYLTLVHRDTIIFASGSALSSVRNHLPYATLIPNTIRPKKMVRISLIAYMPISVAPGLGPGAFLSPAPVFMPLLDSGSRVAL